jgi:hypothetical protein
MRYGDSLELTVPEVDLKTTKLKVCVTHFRECNWSQYSSSTASQTFCRAAAVERLTDTSLSSQYVCTNSPI